MDRVQACSDRKELIGVLGPPKYAMSGEHFGSIESGGEWIRPDRVECYEKDGCTIDICFRDAKLMMIIGVVKMSPWEIVGGTAKGPNDVCLRTGVIAEQRSLLE